MDSDRLVPSEKSTPGATVSAVSRRISTERVAKSVVVRGSRMRDVRMVRVQSNASLMRHRGEVVVGFMERYCASNVPNPVSRVSPEAASERVL